MKKYTMLVFNKNGTTKEFSIADKLTENKKQDAIFRAKNYKNKHLEVVFIYLCKNNNELIFRLA